MRRSAAGILALALAACAVGPDYQRPEAAVSAAYKEAVGWKAAEPRDEASRGNWWEIFGDPKLSALIESIDMSNQNVLLAEARFRQAQALAAQSRAALFPTLDANASVTRSRSSTGPSVDNRSVALNSFWEIDVWGRLRRALESSAASAQASAADLAAARLSAQAELASDYFQLRVLDAQKQLLEDTVTAFGRSLELTRNRYAAGVAAKVDVAQAETQLKSTLAQSIVDAGLRRAQTEEAIAAYDATVAEYRQAVLAGFQEVEDNLAALRILEEEAKVQDEAVRAARESVALTTNQYKAGIVSYINVVTVQTTQLSNERTAVGILGRRLVAAATLVKALGGGWDAAALAQK